MCGWDPRIVPESEAMSDSYGQAGVGSGPLLSCKGVVRIMITANACTFFFACDAWLKESWR